MRQIPRNMSVKVSFLPTFIFLSFVCFTGFRFRSAFPFHSGEHMLAGLIGDVRTHRRVVNLVTMFVRSCSEDLGLKLDSFSKPAC